VLLDTNAEALRRAAKAATITDGKLIRYTQNLSDLVGCELVLESIAENRPAKQALYRQLEPRLSDGCILATNTSTIPISRLTSGFSSPSNFCGMHFCHPVRLRPLVEIIAGTATATDTVARIIAHSLLLGRLPLVVADEPGFVVNRLLMAYLTAALEMVACGIAPQEIDAAILKFGMPMGPLRQLDEIGLDTALHSGIVLSEVSDHRSQGTELLVALVKVKQLGMKASAGVYCYPSASPNPAIEAFIDLRGAKTFDSQFATDQIVSRLLAPMVAEARRLTHDGQTNEWQIDLATIFGLGFPCWRGGLLYWEKGSADR
jgi:3-hydroxyacyl-CoA dehydrogenase